MSSLETRQFDGQPNLPFYSYAIAMNVVALKLSLLNGDTALKYDPILKLKAIFGVRIRPIFIIQLFCT